MHLLVSKPSETAKNEEFPIVATHSDILDSLVDDL